ncbi:MAG: hypothetical protein HY319_12200 [Armatimonadetes bacterium]|nr:hypothetical protein [Armatimonadota bacterium]
MYCLKCKRLVLDADECCGQPLAGTQLPPRVEGNAERLKIKFLEYRTGDINREQLTAYLDREEQRAEQILAHVPGTEEYDEDTLAIMAEELEAGTRGILAYLQALSMAREWILQPSSELLQSALAMAAQGDALVNDAVEMNWRTHRTFLDSAREFLKQMGF